MKYITLTIFTLLLSLFSFATIGPITAIGDTFVCIGSTTYFNDTTSGGAWSSSNTAVATINTSGEVTGILPGTSTITYSVGPSYATITVNVYPAPAPITGPSNVCGGTVTVYDT